MMTERDRANQRNTKAREFAKRYPDEVADAALESAELQATLDEWPPMEAVPVWGMNEDHDSSYVPRVRAAIAKWQKAEDDQTPVWRVSEVWNLLVKWEMSTKRPRKALERWLPQYTKIDSGAVAQKLIDHLAMLPESPESDSGLSLLTKLIEVITSVRAEVDSRRYANLSTTLVNTFYIGIRDQHDGQHDLPFEEGDLRRYALPPAAEPRFEVGYLPGLEPEPSKVVPNAMLNLFGSSPTGRGGPVPVWGRMGWEALLAPEPDDYFGRAADLTITNAGLSAMIWPSTKYKPSRHGSQLREGARMLNDPDNAVEWRESAAAAPILLVVVYMVPTEPYDAKGQVGFYVTRPEGSRQGPQVDRWVLRHLRAQGWRLHRVMLTGYCIWDRYATVKGRLVAPTVPAKVQTNAAGYSTDLRGQVLSDRRGRPTRSTTHPKAVQIGTDRVSHPDLDRYYPWIHGEDLILLGNRTVGATRAVRAKQRELTLRAVTALQSASYLILETQYRKVRGGKELEAVRLLPSDAHRQAHAARWAANRHTR